MSLFPSGIALLALIAVGGLYWKLSARRRSYAREHIKPLKEEIRSIRKSREDRLADAVASLKIEKGNLASARAKFDRLEYHLSLFARDFTKEIKEQKMRKSAGYDHLNNTKQDLNNAYKELKSAKSDLDWWYRKSKRGFFGNGEKPLPKYSVFGQSTNQRDRYKEQRDNAYRQTKKLKSKRDSIYNSEIEPAKRRLAEIHDDIDALKSLKAQRISTKTLRVEQARQGAEIAELKRKIADIEDAINEKNTEIDEEIRAVHEIIQLKWADYKSRNTKANEGPR